MTRYRIMPVLRWDRADPILQATSRFIDRLKHYRPTDIDVLKPSNRDDESDRIAQRWGGRSAGPLLVLDEKGRALPTEKLRHRIEGWELEGATTVTVAVGGAYGTSESLRRSADLVWSLGPCTLPHRLALLVACEQLYRVQTMLRGEPYHHG